METLNTATLHTDPLRPRYHFLPPANWMNDPNGLIAWNDQYHLFYQYNPYAAHWGAIHWGHAVATDLIHWQHLPIALAPSPGAPDAGGCWSGCAVNNGGVPTLIYTGVRGDHETACLATSDDGLYSWRKFPGNPVISGPPAALDTVGFRDHRVWREGDEWRQIIGSGIRGVGGTALLYTSRDLIHWEYQHPLCVGDGTTGEMWECPDFFPLGDKHVLLVSSLPTRSVLAFVGDYRDGVFHPERMRPLDGGDCFYAPQTLLDNRSRRILFGWLQETRSAEEQDAAGWSGALSLPRELSLGDGDTLHVTPLSELASLRAAHHHSRYGLPSDTPQHISGLGHAQSEMCIEFPPPIVGTRGITLSLGDGTDISITYNATRGVVSFRHSAAHTSAGTHPQEVPLTHSPDEPLRFHVFLDRSVIEVFVAERVSVTSRLYPTVNQPFSISLVTEGNGAAPGDVTVEHWQLLDAK